MRNPVRELNTKELDAIAGGSIWTHYVTVHQYVPLIDKITLNPQPLPPGPQPDALRFAGL